MKNNQDYKNSALEALRGNWAMAVVAAIVYFVIMAFCTTPSSLTSNGIFSVSPVLTLSVGGATVLVALLFLMPLQTGYYNAFRKLYNDGDADMTGNMFLLGFRNWGHIVWGMFLMGIFVFLWSLLLFIPGIVKAYSYAMTPYILVDRPDLSANEAINLSRKMMKGRKFDLFYLQLSFIGWGLLCVVTLGIGFLWLSPYIMTAQASFYQDVKADYEMKSVQ